MLIRGCTFVNLPIEPCSHPTLANFDRGVLGIANSTFEPPLDALVTTVQPPDCGVAVAGERVCDERAQCDLAPSGGVRCSCVKEGLRFMPGVPEDGRQCQEDASLRSALEAQSLSMSLSKPSNITTPTRFIVEAHGEAEIAVTFNISITRFEASSGALIPASGSIAIDQPTVSAFGQHIEWKTRHPTVPWRADLDGKKFRYAKTTQHEFGMRLACNKSDEQSCAADGDVITTVVRLASHLDSSLRSEVSIQARVEALVSCQTTVASVTSAGLELRLEPDGGISPASPLEVRLEVRDVDNLEVRFTRADIVLHLEDEAAAKSQQLLGKFPFNTEIGRNVYTTVVGGAWTKEPGRYAIVVHVPKGHMGSCEILRRSITVVSDKTQLIVILVLAGVLLVLLALGGHLLYKNRERALTFALSFLSYEVSLTTDILSELWDFAGCAAALSTLEQQRATTLFCFAGDAFFFVEIRNQSSKPWVAAIATPYTIFFAIACAVSIVAIAAKAHLLRTKLRSRLQVSKPAQQRKLSIGGISIAPQLARSVSFDHVTVVQLKSKFDDLKLQKLLACCHILTGLLEDLPLGKQLSLRLPASGWRGSQLPCFADFCLPYLVGSGRNHEYGLSRAEHHGVCRPRSGLHANARESMQPREVNWNGCPCAQHLDERSDARLQASTYACIL